MGQCCQYNPNQQRNYPGGRDYSRLSEEGPIEHHPEVNMDYHFNLRVFIDINKLKAVESITRIRFMVRYGGEVVKEWREDFRKARHEAYQSKTINIKLDQANVLQNVRVEAQILNSNKKVIENLVDEFSILKSAMNGGMLTAGELSSEQIIKISAFESKFEEEEKEKHHTYRLEMEYNPTHIPCDDIEKVRLGFSLNYLSVRITKINLFNN